MSVIFVFVGQCGNQVGAAVTKALAEGCIQRGLTSTGGGIVGSGAAGAPSPPQQKNFAGPFFSTDGYIRAVLVDAEPKVVESVVKSCGGLIRPSNLVTGRSGRGNSWSLGYCGLPETDEAELQAGAFRVSTAKDQMERDRTVLCRALKTIHAETRRCDDGMVEAIVVLHSLAGGTGSGLGCALIENIRYHFCCDGAEHDNEGGGSGNEDEVDEMDAAGGGGDPMSFGAPFQSGRAASKFMRNSRQQQDQQQQRRDAATKKKNKDLPPSILAEEFIREGVFGEPRRARFVCSVCVAPLVQGELAVQSINACLTLRTLVKNCDAIFLLRNDCHKLFRGLEHSHARGAKAAESSFQMMNNFFASMLVSALQGGTVFGCIAELLEASVDRVAGIDWEKLLLLAPSSSSAGRNTAGANKQQAGRFEWSEVANNGHHNHDEDCDSGINSNNNNSNNNNSSSSAKKKRPRPGPRLLTLVPWDPRAPWAAAFRRSSVTATLCGRDTSRADVTELLAAYLCNAIRNAPAPSSSSNNTSNSNEAESIESQLCCVLDRSATEAGALADIMAGGGGRTARAGAPSARLRAPTPAAATIKPVLVLNQCSELCSSILMPFFRDAATKVDSGAYMHTFNVRGVLEQVFSRQQEPPPQRAQQQQQQQRQQPSFSPPHGGARGGGGAERRFSPRRSNASDRHHAEFARKFINAALVDLLEYISISFPMQSE